MSDGGPKLLSSTHMRVPLVSAGPSPQTRSVPWGNTGWGMWKAARGGGKWPSEDPQTQTLGEAAVARGTALRHLWLVWPRGAWVGDIVGTFALRCLEEGSLSLPICHMGRMGHARDSLLVPGRERGVSPGGVAEPDRPPPPPLPPTCVAKRCS